MRISRIDSFGGSCPPLKPSTKIDPPLGPADGPASAGRSAARSSGSSESASRSAPRSTTALALLEESVVSAGTGSVLHRHLLRNRRHPQHQVQRLRARRAASPSEAGPATVRAPKPAPCNRPASRRRMCRSRCCPPPCASTAPEWASERDLRAGDHRAALVGDLPAKRRGLSEKNLRQQREEQRAENLQLSASCGIIANLR